MFQIDWIILVFEIKKVPIPNPVIITDLKETSLQDGLSVPNNISTAAPNSHLRLRIL